MNIRQIESFIMLANELHYGRAAERLSISQPSLSQQMKLLENKLGVTLFRKAGRRIQLTKAGQVFLQHAYAIQKELDSTILEMKYFQTEQRDQIRLGVSGSHLVMTPFEKFTDAYPDTSLCISEHSTSQTIAKVSDRQLDVGVIYSHSASSDLVTEPLFTDELFAIIPNNFELSEKPEIHLEDLNNMPLILLAKNLLIGDFINKELQKAKVVPNIICELVSHYACLAYSERQLGISLIAGSMLQGESEKVTIKPVEDLNFNKEINLTYRKDLLIDEPLTYLFEEIRKLKFLYTEKTT
ncbi:LysR family transcriptional regulator [Enterococcus sp. 669A]|uniref:LysR family transcriptional regulator n=1 Tax=Candidatus Enterococcus moelleringii TaxID=2815325 RepID=A0ABS3LD43_9ENTE|nr:LysR family transcriptional regulator [Enterococcus sp. 669A]MBO1306289.1 LysR family transcriptional regulator [Enterococcus sp. 669A]